MKEHVTGKSIFNLTRMGSGCLYITHPTPHPSPPANNPLTFLPKPRLPQYKGKLIFVFLISIIITLCYYTFTEEILKNNLFDDRLLYLVMGEALCHQQEKEMDDPESKVRDLICTTLLSLLLY